MKKYELYNGYDEKHYLIPISENRYQVELDDAFPTIRVISAINDNTVEAIDPSGGPFISVGAKLTSITDIKSEEIIEEINFDKCWIIKTKNGNN